MEKETGSFVIDWEGRAHAEQVMRVVRAELQSHGVCVRTATFLAVERVREEHEPNPIKAEAVAGHVDACDDCEKLVVGAVRQN